MAPSIWLLWELDLCEDLSVETLDLNILLLAEAIFVKWFLVWCNSFQGLQGMGRIPLRFSVVKVPLVWIYRRGFWSYVVDYTTVSLADE